MLYHFKFCNKWLTPRPVFVLSKPSAAPPLPSRAAVSHNSCMVRRRRAP
ncbi:hypothetical protein DM45_3793 [Burkholderia mallei]|nr:hypothetical protein DM45_3793 [Burkholderia mallei]